MEVVYTKVLELGFRKLSEQDLKGILKDLIETKALGELIISGNRTLTKFPTQWASALKLNQSLTHVTIDHNDVDDEVAFALFQHKFITHLDIVISKISEDALKNIVLNKNLQCLNLSCLVPYLPENTTLSEQNLAPHRLCEALITGVTALLLETSSLKYLKLSGNKINSESAKKLFKAMIINKSLIDLNLNDNSINADCIKEVTEMLKHNSSLKCLTLKGNELDSAAVKEIALTLLQNHTLTEINLSSNHIEPDADSKEFITLFLQNEKLTSICLSNNQLGNDALNVLAKRVAHNNKPTSIFVDINKSFSDLKGLILALKHSSSLSLALQIHNHENQGLDSIVFNKVISAVMTSSVIKYLILSNCGLGPDEAKTIASFLKQNHTLIHLNLSFNEICAEGVVHIASALTVNKCLLNLQINGDKIGNDGIVALWKALKKNRTLESLGVSHMTHPSEIGIKDLTEVLQCNNVLDRLNISGYQMDSKILEELKAAMEDNKTLITFNIYYVDIDGTDIQEELHYYLERNLNLLRKFAFIAKYIYTHRTDKERILSHISKSDLEEFETFQGQRGMIKLLCRHGFNILEASKVVDYAHFFIKCHFFEITGIAEPLFCTLPLNALCNLSSYLKLKDIH